MRRLETYAALEQLINVQSETDSLEYKGTLQSGQKGADIEIAKDVAALANTIGGHLVIGASVAHPVFETPV